MVLHDPHFKELIAHGKGCEQWDSHRKITWCGNCGNYGIQAAIKRALTLEGLGVRDVVFCFDVGCSGNGSDKIEGYTIHGLHGRVLSLAAGVKLANPNLKVFAEAGDGATFSEGVNHLVHAVRNDYPVIFLHHNNENYGLTTGQPSALSPKGAKLNAAPEGGVAVEPLNPLDFVLSLKPTFVARGFSGEVNHLTDLIREALKHPGFAFIDVLQACPTYNRETPDDWYSTRVRDVVELANYDCTDIWQARRIVQNEDEKFYLGVLYKNPRSADFFAAQQAHRAGRNTTSIEEVKGYDVSDLLKGLV